MHSARQQEGKVAAGLKQRGIFSEYLGQSSTKSRRLVTSGPNSARTTGSGNAEQKSARKIVPAKPQQAPSARTYNRGLLSGRKFREPTDLSTVFAEDNQPKRKVVEPKVIVPFEQRPGKPPRRIEIERKKRLYASQDIEDLLRQEGIDYSTFPVEADHQSGKPSYLPLEIFDDTEYECRSPAEWIEAGTDEKDGLCMVAAKALFFRDGKGYFRDCTVVAHSSKDNKFRLQWNDVDKDEEKQLHKLARIHINFEAENPFTFAKRVGTAHRSRRAFEASIRYQLYVDSMPTDEIQSLDTEQITRVLLLALNTKKLMQSSADTTRLLSEVNIDYARTMNKIIFDVNLKDPSHAHLKELIQLPEDEETPEPDPVPYLGVVHVPFHDFPKHFSDFCFHSFNTKIEAITALTSTNAECLRLSKMNIFKVDLNKTLRLEEFEQLQSANRTQLITFLKDKWTSALKNCIKSSLKEVGKGWFNLNEKNREVYSFSKLKKFMVMVNFMMEDSLRYLVEDSLHAFNQLFNKATAYYVKTRDTFHVEVKSLADAAADIARDEARAKALEEAEANGDEPPAPDEGDEDPPPHKVDIPKGVVLPMFSVDLVLKDNLIQYTTNPDQMQQIPLNLLDQALIGLVDIPQLETYVMEHLFWYGNESKLATVQKVEPWVMEIYENMDTNLKRAIAPMRTYLQHFEKYQEIIDLDLDTYVEEFGENADDLEEVRAEIKKNNELKENIENDIPKVVWLGIVMVNCEDVRRKLANRYKDIVSKEMDLFAKLTKSKCDAISREMQKIQFEIKKTPSDIKELTKMKEYMNTVPMLVSQHKGGIADVMDSYELLESLQYRLPRDAFRVQYLTFGWPKMIHDQMEKKYVTLDKDRESFNAEQNREQEEFTALILEVEKKVNGFGQYRDIDKVKKIADKVTEIQGQLDSLQARAREFNSNEILFDTEMTDYSQLTKAAKNFEPYYQLWTTANDWLTNHDSWLSESFLELNGEQIPEEVNTYNKNITKVLKSRTVKDNAGCLAIAQTIKKEVDQFRPLLPLVSALRNPGMRDRHWDQLSESLPFDFHPDESLTLAKIIDEYKMENYLESVIKVGDTAAKEFQIESALDKMEAAWKGIEFQVPAYKETGTYLIKGVDEIIQLLDEHIVMTQAMQFSPFKAAFDERITKWANKLTTVSEVVDEWLQVQRQWLSLESIFASPDINKQLPAEGKRFTNVNKTWRLIMSQVQANPDVLAYCDNPSLLQKLQEGNKMLTTVQKRLSEYLDKKRAAFSRFYFLANEELLEILSQTQDVRAVQPHLKKCFENINKLRFEEDNTMTAMFSGEGEEVAFTKTLDPKGKGVEFWLTDVEEEMKVSVHHFMKLTTIDYTQCSRSEWVMKWPGQCVLGASQVHFTREVEEAFDRAGTEGIVEYYDKWLKQLTTMVSLVRGNLSKILRIIMGGLITLDVHSRDVIERLIAEKCTNKNDFAWMAQQRYYVEENTYNVIVQMVQSKYLYGYEYLGNSFRLVITPLTDRCYMTLMSALSLNLGGAPAGPAGTGKTETVKDLAKACGKQCVVFNCSDGLNYLAMGKFFKGLASSGAWACFDEFNRIDIEVLSVVAQQIMTIWAAVREGVSTFVFEDTLIKLNPFCSVFITMNPGYAGRTELPDNLAALFRPVAMMVPDYALIGEISLYSFGFVNGKPLARKMVATFRLCSEQLSAQDHYDYGMRAVKTVITRAGILKRVDPDMDEEILLLRALLDVNVPKFLKADLPLFEGIISDLFPGIKKPEVDYGDLMNSIVLTCMETNFQPVKVFLDKCIQLYETTVVRHGLMLVGPTGGAKTTAIRTLAKALTRMHELPDYEKVDKYTINPKAITMGQLYGESDPNTREWADGILPTIVRECIQDTSPTKKWIIFDGPVDAIWIENMNTVLDDNKKLCLVSGEILTLTAMMTMMFEVEDLAVASPATVSRCGMVFLEPTAMGTTPLVKTWLRGLHETFKPVIKELQYHFDNLLNCSIWFIRKQCNEPVPTVDNALATSLMKLLECIFQPYIPVEGARDNNERKERWQAASKHIEPIFIMCLIWSVGASTDQAGRLKFSEFLRKLFAEFEMKNVPPKGALVYDFFFDIKKGEWVSWMTTSPPFQFDAKLSFSETIVPTMDSLRYVYFMDLLALNHKHVVFTGDTGTGKTVNVSTFLSSMPESHVALNLTFSAATSANLVEDLLFSKMQKRRQRVYGPPLGKNFVIFVDDLNMPALETYGAQPPIEILRQYMDHDGWYNRTALQFINIVNCVLVAAMGPPGGGRNPITARFMRHFNQIAHTELGSQSMNEIYTTIVKNTLMKFPEPVQEQAAAVVDASIELYLTVCAELLPTPSKSHYTFNLRDLSKVFQGILSGNPRSLKEADQFIRLWIHENQRVYQDRLINDDDRNWLDALCGKMIEKHFKKDMAEVHTKDFLLFGDYLGGMGADTKNYEEVSDLKQAQKIMEDCLYEYNDENPPMKLVLFLDAMAHVSRISRILRQPGGNALLLGVGGSGRQSLTRLATFMAEYELFTITVTKSYGVNDWHEDVKTMLLQAGLKEQPTVFLFMDTQITKESFLEDVNGILNSADVPNLYNAEDLDNIFATCKADCQRKNIPATMLNAFGQFINRIRANLHVVVGMSPLGDVFRTRLRMFPALINCCTIDWFSDWPVNALESVANTALSEEDYNLTNTEGVVKMFGHIHQYVTDLSAEYKEELQRYNYVTPTSYLELLNVFKFLLDVKRKEVGGLRDKLQMGCDKLVDAQEQVSTLQEDLEAKKPILAQTQIEVAETMVKIEADKKDAATVRVGVAEQESVASAKAAECKEIRDSAQKELDKALPMLDKAVECLKELNKAHIDEVRNFKKPPSGVVLTMEATCIMLKGPLKLKISMKTEGFNKVPDYWDTASKSFLKNPKVLLDTLKSYDKDNIPDTVIAQIKPYIENPDFAVAKIEGASKACRAICMWCHAMYSYSEVAKIVAPKREELKGAEAELAVVTAQLNEAKAALQAVEDRLQTLSDNFDAMTAKKDQLEHDVEMCRVKLIRAEVLIAGLGNESVRWKETIKTLNVAYENIVGDVLVSCGSIAYLGAFTSDYRDKTRGNWHNKLSELNIPFSENCSVRSVLGNPVQIRAWNIQGLPTDAVSTENGIIMSKARRWPLLIDPQVQASKFIKNMGAEKFEEGMVIVKLSDKNFLQSMENAIRFGKWILVENVLEELDPSLDPVLQQQVVTISGQPNIKLGENMIPYNENFHMYLVTKLPNPHYAPELQVKITLLNFTITPAGLEDQMLGVVVAKESPELEQKKNNLVVQNAKMKKQLQDIEDHILRLLSESSGDILEDEELIKVLAESKKTSKEINERVAESEVVEKEIDEYRMSYVPVAQRASLLYFCIAGLAVIDPMYQYSLPWFENLFVLAIEAAAAGNDTAERIENLNSYFTKSLFESVCRSLFENHKSLFAFQLCEKILEAQGKIDPVEWRFLVAGAASKKEVPNPASDWLADNMWSGILALSDLKNFQGFEESFAQNLPSWKRYFDSAEPHNERLCLPWNDKLDEFQKLLVLRCLRGDKMAPAVQSFIANNIGPSYNDSVQFDLELSFADSNNLSALIFVLSTGADPTSKLYDFAAEKGFRDKISGISLGQGQGPIAARHMEDAMKKGGWVLLQNCHLAVSWLPTLERMIEDMKPESTHEDFRLWLTSMPSPKFPVSILQNGVKMTNEPPKGLRANLTRSYYGFTEQQLDACSKPEPFKKLLFSLCFFHAIILDRRKFGPLGWNVPYQFTEEDLQVCVTQLKEFLDMYDEIPFTVIHFLTYDVNYGGRVTDDKDRRTIATILDDYICPSVMSDDYKFSPSGRYTSIPTGTKTHYLQYISEMPINPDPEVFGMHENADMTSAQQQTDLLFETILKMQPRSSGGAGKSREEILAETAKSILEKVPQEWDVETIGKKYPTLYSESMNTVLVQEAVRYNKLLFTIISTLENFLKALKGEMVMTFALEAMATSMFNNTVPTAWDDVAYPSLMPLAEWVNDLLARIAFINQWIDEGVPKVFWISGFFFPQAFLTGSLQNYARKTTKPIDAISFTFHVLDRKLEELTEPPRDGIYIRGLFLQGCRWDAARHSLVESRPKELFVSFPVMWLQPEFEKKDVLEGYYKCPVYKILTRAGVLMTTGHSTNFVLYAMLPTTVHERVWIKAGVALFCALRY